MRGLVFLSFIFFFNISVKAQKVFKYHDKRFNYKLTIDSVLSADSVNYNCAVKRIVIIRKSDNKLIQTILPPENVFFCNLPQDQILIIGDVNFDKVNDIRMVQFIPAEQNIPYYYWIFNSLTQTFEINKSLENITSPEFDYRRKEITSFWSGGCCDHGLRTYKYINNKAILIKEVEVAKVEGDTTRQIMTVKKRINGKMRIIEKKTEHIGD